MYGPEDRLLLAILSLLDGPKERDDFADLLGLVGRDYFNPKSDLIHAKRLER